MDSIKCVALTKKGEPCKNKALTNGTCGVHSKKPTSGLIGPPIYDLPQIRSEIPKLIKDNTLRGIMLFRQSLEILAKNESLSSYDQEEVQRLLDLGKYLSTTYHMDVSDGDVVDILSLGSVCKQIENAYCLMKQANKSADTETMKQIYKVLASYMRNKVVSRVDREKVYALALLHCDIRDTCSPGLTSEELCLTLPEVEPPMPQRIDSFEHNLFEVVHSDPETALTLGQIESLFSDMLRLTTRDRCVLQCARYNIVDTSCEKTVKLKKAWTYLLETNPQCWNGDRYFDAMSM